MEDIKHSAAIQIVLRSQNYKDICVNITIHRTERADREDTPDPDAFDMTFTVSGNDLAAQITTDRTDVEFSFDGTDWGQTKSTGVGHNEKVIAQIRYAETDDYNASPAVSKTRNSGHGPLTHHDRVEPTCQAEGSIEYWTCDVCGLYFASADGSKSITAAEIVLPKTDHSWAEGYLSDMTGHWHKCGVCGITSNTEKHASGGAATTERAEICTICGYEIAPKKPAASNDDDDDDDDDEDGGEATLSEQNLYRRLSEYYDLLEDLDNYVRGCAQNFNGSYLEEDRTTRQNLADVAERTEDTIEQYYDIVEDLDVPTSSKNYSSWKDIIALYDDLDHRIDAICDAWEISLKYAKPADHKNEIVAPLSRDNVAGTNDNKYRLDFEERYPGAKPVEVN